MNRSCVFSVVLVLFVSQSAMAANQVVFAGAPTTAPGAITVSGSCVPDAGWTWSGVAMNVFPVGGGEAKSQLGAAKPMNMWGPITINGLPAGSYAVTVSCTFTKPAAGGMPAQSITIVGPLQIVTVP